MRLEQSANENLEGTPEFDKIPPVIMHLKCGIFAVIAKLV